MSKKLLQCDFPFYTVYFSQVCVCVCMYCMFVTLTCGLCVLTGNKKQFTREVGGELRDGNSHVEIAVTTNKGQISLLLIMSLSLPLTTTILNP